MPRRTALRLLAGSAGLPLLGCQPSSSEGSTQAASDETTKSMPDTTRAMPQKGEMRRRAIPSSGEMLPVVGLGTWQQFDVGEAESKRTPLKKVLRQMVELGGSVVDSSPMYGRAERVVGELSAELGLTDEIFAATKVWTRGKQDGIRQMKSSIEKMNSRPMDLMQVHNLMDWQTHLETLRTWKEEERIRYTGVTHYVTSAFDELASVITETGVDFVQLPYSIRTRQAEERLLPLAADNDTAVLVNQPYEGGRLFGAVGDRELPSWAQSFAETWGQFFLKFILARPEVTCVIPGTSDPEHLHDNMRAGYGALPDVDTRRRMAEYVDQL
jgi:diketogulonate reductase-like aldo/keto reductase